jgi:hypothetical protein
MRGTTQCIGTSGWTPVGGSPQDSARSFALGYKSRFISVARPET